MIFRYSVLLGIVSALFLILYRLLTARLSIIYTSAPNSLSLSARLCPIKPAPPTSTIRLPDKATILLNLRKGILDGFDHVVDVFFIYVRPHGQGYRVIADTGRHRETGVAISVLVFIICEVRNGVRVIHAGAHAALLQVIHYFKTLGCQRLLEYHHLAVITAPEAV